MTYSRYPSIALLLAWGWGLLALLALAGCSQESTANPNNPPRQQISIAITDRGCDLPEVTTPAGKTKFTIANRGTVPLEWEILNGVMVVEEIENILPGTKKRPQNHPRCW
jgi:iron uptake system component EfeO